MKNKALFILFLILATVLGITAYTLRRPVFSSHSSFVLQKEYAKDLEEKLVNLLEPAVGVGNIRVSIQANITHQDIVKKRYNPVTLTETRTHERGPVLNKQSVSVLINGKSKKRLSVYRDLIKAAIGFDMKRGDRLSVKMLSFVAIPLWTLGLTPLVLVRIGAVLILLILLGSFWLFKEWHQNTPKQSQKLWIDSSRLDVFLKWSDEDIQKLLHYVSKQDFIKALQGSSWAVRNVFRQNIPPALWQELMYQGKKCSEAETQRAQKKILRLAELLKESA